jgi:hypothetical protein
VPQFGQKVRVTFSLEAKRFGSPATKRNPSIDALNQATTGAAAMRLQSAQWQSVE